MEQLTQQVAALTTVVTTVVTEQGKIIKEQGSIIKRVVLQPAIEVYSSFHADAHFFAPTCRSLFELFKHTFEKFDVNPSAFVNPRFYWLPSGDLTTQQRIDQRKTFSQSIADGEKWNSFVEEWSGETITLTFVAGEESPAFFSRPPPSPPRLRSVDGDEVKSEPESVKGLAERDGQVCFICGVANPEAAHVVDKHREELLFGAPDAPEVNDVRNHLQLCPNHHSSFDRFEWTLVETHKHSASSGSSQISFLVRRGLVNPLPGTDIISPYMQKEYHFSNSARSPPSYLFLLKQLGRFKVPCRCCGQLWDPHGLPGHYGGAHKSDEEKQRWKDLPHLLPRPCECADRGTTAWELYCHVVNKHSKLLYV